MDLNIDNYSITDLENFFKFQPKKYSLDEIEKREYEIREQLLSSGHINKKFKRDLITFLKEAKDRLSQTIPHQPPQPLSIIHFWIKTRFQNPPNYLHRENLSSKTALSQIISTSKHPNFIKA